MSRYIATLVYLFSPHPLRCLSTTIHNRLITCMPSILELFCNTNPPHLEHCASRAQTRTGFVTTSSLAIGIDKQASLKSLSGSGTTYTNIFKMLHFHRTLSTVPLNVSPNIQKVREQLFPHFSRIRFVWGQVRDRYALDQSLYLVRMNGVLALCI